MSCNERARLRLIGGSQFASFIRCLETTYSQETFATFLQKTFETTVPENNFMKIGSSCEEAIIKSYEDVEESNRRRIHADFGTFKLCSTPDIILKSGKIVEIKTKCKDRGRNPITNQHALQLVYYMAMNNKTEGSLVYYTPDPEFNTIHLITEYQIRLCEKELQFFKDTLLFICEAMFNLLPGQVKPIYVGGYAMVLKDYARLFVHRISPDTPLIIEEWPTDLDALLDWMK